VLVVFNAVEVGDFLHGRYMCARSVASTVGLGNPLDTTFLVPGLPFSEEV